MSLPPIPPWVEEPDDPAGGGVDRRQVCSLVAVAEEAGPGEVLRFGSTSVPGSNEVVRFVGRQDVLFVDQAEFALPLCSCPHQPAEGGRDTFAHGRFVLLARRRT